MVKSGYQFLQKEFQNTQPRQFDVSTLKPLWQAIWNLLVLSKVKNLVWRATKNSLPSKDNLVRRKIIQDAGCEACREHNENVKHALYSCPKLEELWKKIPLWNHENLRRMETFVDLIGTIFAENREPMLFAMVVWALWTWRNNLRLGKNVENLDQLLQRARERVSEFSVHNTAKGAPGGSPITSWQPPGPSQYKVNVVGLFLLQKIQLVWVWSSRTSMGREWCLYQNAFLRPKR